MNPYLGENCFAEIQFCEISLDLLDLGLPFKVPALRGGKRNRKKYQNQLLRFAHKRSQTKTYRF